MKADDHAVTVFNPLSFASDLLTVCDPPADTQGVTWNGQAVPAQMVREEEGNRLIFVAEKVPAFGFREFRFEKKTPAPAAAPFRGSATELEGPFYRLKVDAHNGGLSSIARPSSGQELLAGPTGRSLCQTVFFDGKEQRISNVESKLVANGPVLARLSITGSLGPAIRVTNFVTLYAVLDRVDFEVHIEKTATTNEQRLVHFFPVTDGLKDLRIETTAAVLRPRPQPEGDLLPGADPRRFAVQGFVDYSPAGRPGITIAPLDAFMLRLDQDALAFEALGNDQNWKEVSQDQDGVTRFRFRYRLRAHGPGYDNATTLAWSRSVTAPMTIAAGRLPKPRLDRPHLEVDPARGLATCFKPADDLTANQVLVRLWETSGSNGPMVLLAPGYRQAKETDLLERDRGELPVKKNRVSVNPRGYGFSAVKLER